MEGEKLKRRKVIVSNSIIPYFIGISGDLMFFIAISTLFLTIVKGLSAAEITFLTTISNLSYILLQVPALKIIQKIGNRKAIQIGTIMLLSSSLLITFGNGYLVILIGYLLYQPSFLFIKMEHVIVKNNLKYLKKEEDYIKVANRANIIYSVITMLIALVAGGIFAINHYLPMYFCIGICVLNVILTLGIFDINEDKQETKEQKIKTKTKFSNIAIMTLIFFALLYPAINVGQSNTSLFIQYHLQEYFDIGLTATYLSFIIVSSRIARILGNIAFKKAYSKMQDKVSILLSGLTALAFFCIIVGSFLGRFSLLLKFVVMTIGLDLILATRDPLDAYANDLILKNTTEEQQQKAISYLQLARRIVATTISLVFSMLLLKIDLLYIIICSMILAILGLGANIKLYNMIKGK